MQSLGNLPTIIWASLESIALLLVLPVWLSKRFSSIEKSLDKLNYAVFNSGKTGLKNIVDEKLPVIEKNLVRVATHLGVELE